MAIIKSTSGDKIDVKDGSALIDSCIEMGVPFGCTAGSCGVCKCNIAEGLANLNPKTEAEMDFPLNESERLICQCLINSGEVEIEID